jgi:NAD(P)H-dependent FMN reductase
MIVWRLNLGKIVLVIDGKLQVLAVVGSMNKVSASRVVVTHVAERLRAKEAIVDLVDLMKEPLDLFNPDSAYGSAAFAGLQTRVDAADVFVLGTPDYHGSISSVMKNFLDHFWHEFAGKLFATIVASHEKGLTVTDQLRTVARQCYAWSLPYGISFTDKDDLKEGAVYSETLKSRLAMLVQDISNYGPLLAGQRTRDLAGTEPGFMARHRRKS